MANAATEEIDTLIGIDLAASTLFEGTGLIDDSALDDHVPSKVFEHAIESGNLLTARDKKGQVVGFALLSRRQDTLYLDQISVHPDHGRMGLGGALITRVLEEAKFRKLKTVTLSTFRDLAWNGPFYRRHGFKEIARKKMDGWMLELEKVQEATLDMSQRCFMRRKVRWL